MRTLDQNSGALVGLLVQGGEFLHLVVQRQAVVSALLKDTARLGAQLRVLMQRNGAQLDTFFASLDTVSRLLVREKGQLQRAIVYLGQFGVNITNVTGAGPWLDLMSPTVVVPDNQIKNCGPNPATPEETVQPMTRRAKLLAAAIAGGLVVVLLGGFLVYRVFVHEDTYKITARFTATPGLYADNSVDILGVEKGTIDSITPTPNYVEVVLSLPTDVKVPANAKAVLMAPNPVSDRFVELTPPYTGGPSLADGAIIDMDDTVVPLELDSVYASLDDLSTALGPEGANANGELSSLLHSLAGLADGNGKYLHHVIDRVAAALPALTAHPEDLANLIRGLDQLTGRLRVAQRRDQPAVRRSGVGNRTARRRAGHDLGGGVEPAARACRRRHLPAAQPRAHRLVRAEPQHDDRGDPGRAARAHPDLRLGAARVPELQPRDRPERAVSERGRGAGQLRRAVGADRHAERRRRPGQGVLRQGAGLAASRSCCGISAWRNATATHTGCGAQVGLLQGRSGPPGAPQSPDLDLTHYLGSR